MEVSKKNVIIKNDILSPIVMCRVVVKIEYMCLCFFFGVIVFFIFFFFFNSDVSVTPHPFHRGGTINDYCDPSLTKIDRKKASLNSRSINLIDITQVLKRTTSDKWERCLLKQHVTLGATLQLALAWVLSCGSSIIHKVLIILFLIIWFIVLDLHLTYKNLGHV